MPLQERVFNRCSFKFLSPVKRLEALLVFGGILNALLLLYWYDVINIEGVESQRQVCVLSELYILRIYMYQYKKEFSIVIRIAE